MAANNSHKMRHVFQNDRQQESIMEPLHSIRGIMISYGSALLKVQKSYFYSGK